MFRNGSSQDPENVAGLLHLLQCIPARIDPPRSQRLAVVVGRHVSLLRASAQVEQELPYSGACSSCARPARVRRAERPAEPRGQS